MMEKFQRFGGAMFTPVLLFSFSGIMLALTIIFKNPDRKSTRLNSSH